MKTSIRSRIAGDNFTRKQTATKICAYRIYDKFAFVFELKI